MAAPQYKITYFFEDNSALGAGWVETYYINAASLAAALSAATSSGQSVRRQGILAPGYVFNEIRATPLAFPSTRVSLVNQYTVSEGIGQFPPSGASALGDVSEPPYDALLLRLDGMNGHRRMFLLRGIPTGVVSNSRFYTPDATWVTRFTAWANYVTSGPSQWQILTQKAPIAGATTPTLVLLGADSRSLVFGYTGSVPASLQPNVTIKVSGLTGANPVNHNWRIKNVAGLSVYTYPQRRTIFGSPVLGGCQVTPVVYDSDPVAFVTAIRGVKRDTGRPFDLLRGRRSARQT